MFPQAVFRGAKVLLIFSGMLWLSVPVSRADHSAIISRARPEHVMAGIDVYRTKLTQAATLLGKPDEITKEDVDGAPGAVFRNYLWKLGSCVLTASGYVVRGEDTGLYFVSLEGCLTAPVAWRTSAGLAIGMSPVEVKRLYGTRFSGDANSGERAIDYEFRDGTTLRVEFDEVHRANKITLMAEVE